MHGCDSGPVLVVNAEVDSMGGVIDGRVGTGVKTSPRRVAIEKAQAELRQEYDVREERKRELEFLEKGGNPLDFKFGNAASLSVQSTSLIDQQAEHILTSEAKGSFALTASPHGDSVESSGRPGVSESCEPNSADNLLLLDGENESCEGERNFKHPNKRNSVLLSEQSSQVDGTQNAKDSEDSAIFRPYARRNRSKINRDVPRSSSADFEQDRGASLPARGLSNDAQGSMFEAKNQKVQDAPSMSYLKSVTSNGDVVKMVTSVNQLKMELVGMQGREVPTNLLKGEVSNTMLNVDASKNLSDNQYHEPGQVGAHKPLPDLASEKPDAVERKECAVSTGSGCPGEVGKKDENETSFGQVDGFCNSRRDTKHIPTEKISSAVIAKKGLDSSSSCPQNSLSLDVNKDHDVCTNPNDIDSNRRLIGQTLKLGVQNLAGDQMVKEKNEVKDVENIADLDNDNESAHRNNSVNDSVNVVEEDKKSEMQSESVPLPTNNEARHDFAASEADSKVGKSEIDKKYTGVPCDISASYKQNSLADRPQVTIDAHACMLPETTMSGKITDAVSGAQSLDNVSDKVHEDSILEEARIIEAKRKRIAELSVGTVTVENRHKSHWDFVIEEMVWLANDFSQERLWKMAAAAQICRRVAQTARLRFEEQNQRLKIKKVAFTLANAVMQFWKSVEVLRSSDASNVASNNGLDDSRMAHGEKNSFEQQHFRKRVGLSLRDYAIRFLKQNSFAGQSFQTEAPVTPERTSDSGIVPTSLDEQLTEESLFYALPSGAAEAYRISVESYVEQTEKSGSSVQEEVETSVLDAGADFGYHDDIYDEDDGETSTFDFSGAFERSKSLKFNQKKRKNSMKSTAARLYNMGPDFPYGNCTMEAQQVLLMGKRPASLNVGSIPTKRVRTGSRQRILSTFSNTGAAVVFHPAKTDASSGDTNSFQDDLNTLNEGSLIQKSVEVESVGEFEKRFPYDYAETVARPKKKKKASHLGSAYDQGWQLESTVHSEQRDHIRKRLEGHQLDSNGSNGLIRQQNSKRPKIMKQQLDNAVDIALNGCISSPLASQMSNMSNPTKVIRILGGHDKGRKTKASKISAGQLGSGSPWSLFEDQALVVLVHDMGPNWGLVCDAINSALQFKCVFRKPNECKERHRILMDGSGDGADSADDSGSAQSYTLPGIPKGSARQLFQRLQGPMEEDTLKLHFEKIIIIGKKQQYRRNQDDNLEPKRIVSVHSSHVDALKQVCPNNLNEVILTPLDLCDVTPSSQDVLPYQASHTTGLAISSEGAIGLNFPPSAVSPMLQGSSVVVGGGNLSSLTAPLGAPLRDARFGFSRTPMAVDEQHRTQQYNHVFSGRNIPQSNLSVPGPVAGVDRAARVLPGGNGMGVTCGTTRSMTVPRPGFQGIASSSMLNSGSMLSSSIVGMPSPVNMHSGPGSGQGSSTPRPHDGMHMIRPGHNPEHPRQLMVPELQMQVSQGNNTGIPGFNGLSSAFPIQTSSPSVQTYPGHSQQQHQISPQHSNVVGNSNHPHLQGQNHATGSPQQVYAIQLAKERQMRQQRLMQKQQLAQQQQQQQFSAGGSALTSHVQQQAQLPISAPLQSSSEIQSQTSFPSLASSSPMMPVSLQRQQKHHLSPFVVSHNPQSGASGLTNQISKQRQRQQQQQPFQQSGRQHPQHQQQTPSQHQAKLLKGMGRGSMPVHQNRPVGPSHLNGISMVPGNQAAEKGEQLMHLMQGQGLYTGSGLSAVQPSKPLASPRSSNHSQSQQKLLSMPPTAKQLQPMPPHSNDTSQGQAPAIHQAVLPAVVATNHQHLPVRSQPNQKQVNQSQPAIQRMLQQNCKSSSDSLSKSQAQQHKSDQLPVNSVSKMDSSTTMAMPQACSDSTDTKPIVSTAVAQWKSSEQVHDTDLPNISTQVGSSGSGPVTSSILMDAIPSVSQGLGQRQLSGSLVRQAHSVVAHRQQQQPQRQQSSIPPLASQQSYERHEQLQDQNQSPRQQ